MEHLSMQKQRMVRVRRLGDEQEGVVSRRQIYAIGVTRGEVRAHVRARRWRRVGTQSIAMHKGPLPAPAKRWAAVFEAGPRAFLDGASSLLASGLEHFDDASIRVSVPKGARVRRGTGLNIRETRRWRAEDVMSHGVPRSRPAVAAVRGALWARSNRAAALVLTMTVQQGLCRAEDVAVEMLSIRRDKRRSYLYAVVLDLVGGVRSLGELDVVRGCRERGLPEPDKQVLRRTSSGKYFLDLRWPRWHLVVEVDGIQHAWASLIVPDAIRQNSVAIQGDTVLRLPLLGLRVCPDEFFGQIEQALRVAGYPFTDRHSA
ncbi:MAG: DUF559 domain-containing protein [Nocardioidaceae bacterium]